MEYLNMLWNRSHYLLYGYWILFKMILVECIYNNQMETLSVLLKSKSQFFVTIYNTGRISIMYIMNVLFKSINKNWILFSDDCYTMTQGHQWGTSYFLWCIDEFTTASNLTNIGFRQGWFKFQYILDHRHACWWLGFILCSCLGSSRLPNYHNIKKSRSLQFYNV